MANLRRRLPSCFYPSEELFAKNILHHDSPDITPNDTLSMLRTLPMLVILPILITLSYALSSSTSLIQELGNFEATERAGFILSFSASISSSLCSLAALFLNPAALNLCVRGLGGHRPR
jgi:hypothetical protein